VLSRWNPRQSLRVLPGDRRANPDVPAPDDAFEEVVKDDHVTRATKPRVAALAAAATLAITLPVTAWPQASSDTQQPTRRYSYREVGGRSLHADVFLPVSRKAGTPSAAVLLFHGGGWSAGSAEWTHGAARRFAALGLVAISIEYRLSGGDVTPIDALEDTCAAFRWARRHATELALDPARVAGYGVSAGGHLVAAAATVGCPGETPGDGVSRPDALLLWSPALDVAADRWFGTLLGGRANASRYSPAEHAGGATPPTCIVHGERDTLTPLSGAKRFCDQVLAARGVCALHVYPNVGHLLTRNLGNQESDFDPDPEARADGLARLERFLVERGFVPET